ncbi:MAG: hypothetical protein K8I65_16370, partial [Thermoanaerobaculia bacterium]|nr:hypothetical protein [Thermoanaerobaculia bacterium]
MGELEPLGAVDRHHPHGVAVAGRRPRLLVRPLFRHRGVQLPHHRAGVVAAGVERAGELAQVAGEVGDAEAAEKAPRGGRFGRQAGAQPFDPGIGRLAAEGAPQLAH